MKVFVGMCSVMSELPDANLIHVDLNLCSVYTALTHIDVYIVLAERASEAPLWS
jgi:hypothetical protein